MARLSLESRATLADGRTLQVRSARPRDAKAVVGLLNQVAAEEPVTLLVKPGEAEVRPWRRRIAAASADHRSVFLLGIVAGATVASLSVERDPHPNSAHVAWVGVSVARPWRGQGIGGTLLETAADWASAAGLRKLTLGVFPENAPALAFYERHEFAREGVRRAQYLRAGRYHDEVLMARYLTGRH